MSGQRVSQVAAERLAADLGRRDRSVLLDLHRVRVLSGAQLSRLHFVTNSATSRDRTRRRVLARLAAVDLVSPLDRRIGGVRAGSTGLVWTLGLAGQHVVRLLTAGDDSNDSARPRRPWTPGHLFLRHSLAVSELYVRLRELERTTSVRLVRFDTEPASWQPDGFGGYLKADAYAVLRLGTVEDSWRIEVDRATESLPTLRRKLLAYVDSANAGQVGPAGVIPRVLVTVPRRARLEAIKGLLDGLSEPATELIVPVLHDRATQYLHNVVNSTVS